MLFISFIDHKFWKKFVASSKVNEMINLFLQYIGQSKLALYVSNEVSWFLLDEFCSTFCSTTDISKKL